MSRTTRRQFARTITAVTAAMPVVAADLFGQATTPYPPPAATAAPPALAIALAGIVSAQSGQFLSEDEMQRIYDGFKNVVPYLERFRDYELKNADEPDFTFHSLTERW